jgi:sensor histidine kinase regulating citrate/malate metabolism
MTLPASLNIRPSPRILRVLGDIEFEPWQCIAELIDNAFDDFLEVHRKGQHWPDGFKVSVSLPSQASADATIVIEDTGRGMSLDVLNNAVRAGWSSNDRFSKLGLFGMGFNIATARLGRVARVLTTRAEDSE